MKWITAVLALLLLHQPAWAQDSEARAREIIDEAARRTAGFQDFTANLTMTIRDADGAGRDHEMQGQVLEVPEDGQRTLLIFDRANVRGMMILTIAIAVWSPLVGSLLDRTSARLSSLGWS